MRPEEIHKKRVLFSPLNWGMGHVARSISLLIGLQQNQNKLIIACDEAQQRIFEEYLSNVTYLNHEGYPFKFGGKGRFGWDLLKETGALQKRLKSEQEELRRYIEAEEIDLVVSDHRYGFRSDEVTSVFITHQYNLPTKWYEKGVDRLHKRLISRFNHIWVMDRPDSSLAGELSMNNDPKAVFIGPYSRFSLYDIPKVTQGTVLIASGPDIYAQQLIDAYKDEKLIVICNSTLKVSDLHIRKGKTWREKDEVILNGEKIISRAGYSTIMDIDLLKKKCELTPTPGQSEQIYLAKKYGA